MELNVLIANIIGVVISAIGIILYTWSIYEDRFSNWKTWVGFSIVVMGALTCLIISGALSPLLA